MGYQNHSRGTTPRGGRSIPPTVHGTGGQTRAFIRIQDTVRCIQIALENPPRPGERVQIFNQMTETHRARFGHADLIRLPGKPSQDMPARTARPVPNDAAGSMRYAPPVLPCDQLPKTRRGCQCTLIRYKP